MSFSKIYFKNDKNLNATERFGHVAAMYNDRFLIVYGGCNYFSDTSDINNSLENVWVYDTVAERWRVYATTGDKPIRCSGACGLIHEDNFYLFGGFTCGRHINDLHRLNLKTFEWTKVVADMKRKSPSPRDKFSGWVWNDRLYYFGGFGPEMGSTYMSANGEFIVDPEFMDRNVMLGWHNQLIYYDIKNNQWQNPKFNGTIMPQPRAAHSCIHMSENKVVLFGGRTLNARTNDLFVLDLLTLSWSKNLSSLFDVNPPGRSWMSSVRLNENEVFVYGGFNGDFEALGDAWIINIDKLTCTEILIDKLEKRLWHTANVVNKTKDVYIFGGCYTNITSEKPELPLHILKISTNPKSLKEKCIDLICSKFKLFEPLIESNNVALPLQLKTMICNNLDIPTMKTKPNRNLPIIDQTEY